MICTFFGHKDSPYILKGELKKLILHLIDNRGVKNFYVGNNGNFDFLVQVVLKEILSDKDDIHFSIVLSFLGEKALSNEQKHTVFPEGLEFSLPRFAISKRNEWMLRQADFAVVYVNHHFSNAYKWLEKATAKGIEVINLSETYKKEPSL